MAQNWTIDPLKRDYVMEGGAPKQTDSLLIPAYIRMKVKRKKWMYAPDDQYGSDFYLIQKNLTSQDATRVENTAANALRPLVVDGRAEEISVQAVGRSRHDVGIQTKILDARGENEETSIIPVGA
jgi:phage gp46-like protein